METNSPSSQPMAPAGSPQAEAENHHYVGAAIPWYVRVLWLGFWVLCIWYILSWLIPALKLEMVSPP
jgi:hypothetical protein